MVKITAPPNEPFTLDDNLFGDITFEYFYGINIKKIGSNVFNKTADKIKTFICADCSLEHEPPKYNLQTIFNQISQFNLFKLQLNMPNEIVLNSMDISSLREEAFKSVLDNEKNIINFETSKIDCSNCKNYWLIKGKAACQSSLCSLPCAILIQIIIMLLFALYLCFQAIITSMKMIIR